MPRGEPGEAWKRPQRPAQVYICFICVSIFYNFEHQNSCYSEGIEITITIRKSVKVLSAQTLLQSSPASAQLSSPTPTTRTRVGARVTHPPGWVTTPVDPGRTPTVHRCPKGEAVGGPYNSKKNMVAEQQFRIRATTSADSSDYPANTQQVGNTQVRSSALTTGSSREQWNKLVTRWTRS